jgi:hypothetical protein
MNSARQSTGHSISAAEEVLFKSQDNAKPAADNKFMSTFSNHRMLLGSVAEHVVRYAECPVIIVPSRRSRF